MNDDASQYKASNFLKKNDDASQYHASNFLKKKERKPGLLERAANDVQQHINEPIESLGRAARDMAGGFGQGVANVAPGLYNLGASGINALGGNTPKSPMFDFVPHSPSQQAGEIGSFFLAPGLLKGLARLPEFSATANSAMKIPLIAQGIKHASNLLNKSPIASGIAGNAILGGAYSPENPLIGMGLGAAGGAIGSGIGKAYNYAKNAPSIGQAAKNVYTDTKNALENNEFLQNMYSKVNPEAQAKEMEHYLSGGSNNVTKNSKELAKDIRNAYKSREQEAGEYFNYALNKAGDQKIYRDNPVILNKIDEAASTLNKIKEFNIGDLYHSFKSNPTFSNAHKLQSELFSRISELKSNPLKTEADRVTIGKLEGARRQLKDEISTFLKRHDMTSNQPLAEKYQKGSDLFKEHVAPYLENNKILDITRGGQTDIKNLHNAFNTPTNRINRHGVEEIGSINKIMQDLPENAKNRILFNAIGGTHLTPESLLNKLNQIKSKGFGSYFTPEVEEGINALGKKLKNKHRLTTGLKVAGLGAAAGGANKLAHLF